MKEVRNEGRQACEGGGTIITHHQKLPEVSEIITYTKRTLKELSFSLHPKDETTMTHHVWFLMQNHVRHNLPPTQALKTKQQQQLFFAVDTTASENQRRYLSRPVWLKIKCSICSEIREEAQVEP
jgi:hypothetical protein